MQLSNEQRVRIVEEIKICLFRLVKFRNYMFLISINQPCGMPRAGARGIGRIKPPRAATGSVAHRCWARRHGNATEDSVRLIGKARRVEQRGQGLVGIAVAEDQ